MFEQLTFLLLKLHFGYVRKCFVEFGVSGREVCGPPSKGSGKRVSVCACERDRGRACLCHACICACAVRAGRVCAVCVIHAPRHRSAYSVAQQGRGSLPARPFS